MLSEPWLEKFLGGVGGTLFMDIGANTGDWSLWATDRFTSVHAYEPDPRAVDIMKNRCPCSVVIHPKAVGAEPGRGVLHARQWHLQSTMLDEHPLGHGDSIADVPVEVTSVAAERLGPCWIKIDVEGYEVEVIRGLPDARAGLIVECHGTFDEVVENLRAKGYFKTKSGVCVNHPLGIADHNWLIVPGEHV
jgi:FkbM family methyltransferase